MRHCIIHIRSFLLLLLIIMAGQAIAQLRLPRLISDGMVLQRDQPVPIWGWAKPGEKITISINEQTVSAAADDNGKWKATLSPMQSGGPYTLTIRGSEVISIRDVLIGEVWVCSGQSNMEFIMARVKDKYPDIITSSANSQIRQYLVERDWKFTPVEDTKSAGWTSADPKSVLKFTAVGYFFALDFYNKYHIPIGIINSCVGGTPAEAWVSAEGLKDFPELLRQAEPFKDSAFIARTMQADQKAKDDWNHNVQNGDKGIQEQVKWSDAAYNYSSWEQMNMPAAWESNGLKNLDGVVWFEKDINFTEEDVRSKITVYLGNILEQDSTFIDGHFIGFTSDKHTPRKYEIAGNAFSAGYHHLVIRILNMQGPGGFVLDKPFYIETASRKIALAGSWKYKIGYESPPYPSNLTRFNFQPTSLFNTMIAPLVPYAIKGVLWYQGEANAERGIAYRKLLPALINDWRAHWGQKHLPFLYVQLPNFKQAVNQPVESDWAELREAQAMTLRLPETGMAVTIDIGEWNDVHPLDKQDVGKRLFLVARHIVYHDDNIVYMGPTYAGMMINKDSIRINFENTGSGLLIKGDTLARIAIAGNDHRFVWANARITNNSLVVWSSQVHDPVVVRYAWADNPSGCNLYNKEGLPAAPFRTDGWLRSSKTKNSTN